MTHPGVALMVMVGVGLGAFLYYMFADNNNHGNHGNHQYGNQNGGYGSPPSEPSDPWSTGQDERARRRKRGSTASTGKPSCTICLTELADKESLQLFPCKHEFHRNCITKWREQGPLEARNTCPNCREGIFGGASW